MDKQRFSFPANETITDEDTVCYCFGYTQRDIENDCFAHDGRSTILERIIREKRAGGCNCAHTNPRGR